MRAALAGCRHGGWPQIPVAGDRTSRIGLHGTPPRFASPSPWSSCLCKPIRPRANPTLSNWYSLNMARGNEQDVAAALLSHIEVPKESDREKLRLRLAEAVSGLDEAKKTVLILYYFEGLGLAQIAEILGVPKERVSSLHTDAVLIVRDALNEVLFAQANTAEPDRSGAARAQLAELVRAGVVRAASQPRPRGSLLQTVWAAGDVSSLVRDQRR